MHTMVFVVCFRVADGVLLVSDYCGGDRQLSLQVVLAFTSYQRSCLQLVPANQLTTRTRNPAYSSRTSVPAVDSDLVYFQIQLLALPEADG